MVLLNRLLSVSVQTLSTLDGSLTPASAAEVVRQAQAGHRDAMRNLYLLHSPLVYRVARNATRSDEDAKDITQDSFIRAFADVASLRQPEAFRGWLLNIALARCRHWARREKLKRVLGIESGAVTESVLVTSHLRAEAQAALSKLFRRVRELPLAEQQAWQLRYLEECTLVEVAAALGCSLATAKRRLAAAETRLSALAAEPQETPHG